MRIYILEYIYENIYIVWLYGYVFPISHIFTFKILTKSLLKCILIPPPNRSYLYFCLLHIDRWRRPSAKTQTKYSASLVVEWGFLSILFEAILRARAMLLYIFVLCYWLCNSIKINISPEKIMRLAQNDITENANNELIKALRTRSNSRVIKRETGKSKWDWEN